MDKTTEFWMTKYIIGEIFNSGGATLYKNFSDQTVFKVLCKSKAMLPKINVVLADMLSMTSSMFVMISMSVMKKLILVILCLNVA